MIFVANSCQLRNCILWQVYHDPLASLKLGWYLVLNISNKSSWCKMPKLLFLLKPLFLWDNLFSIICGRYVRGERILFLTCATFQGKDIGYLPMPLMHLPCLIAQVEVSRGRRCMFLAFRNSLPFYRRIHWHHVPWNLKVSLPPRHIIPTNDQSMF